jgi:hypothetical protein
LSGAPEIVYSPGATITSSFADAPFTASGNEQGSVWVQSTPVAFGAA